jgi:hypothetical protein
VTARRQARHDAIRALLTAGWEPERVALAFALSRATVERVASRGGDRAPVVRIAALSTGTCCQLVDGDRYCDAPLAVPGSIYCRRHYSLGWPA